MGNKYGYNPGGGNRGGSGFGGGNNMQSLMKQAQQMQQKMLEAQNSLEELQVTGSAGGGMVQVVCNGKKSFCRYPSSQKFAIQMMLKCSRI